MSMTADQIVDRRRLRRKLTFWRVVGFLAILDRHRRCRHRPCRARRLSADSGAADRPDHHFRLHRQRPQSRRDAGQARQDRRRQGRHRFHRFDRRLHRRRRGALRGHPQAGGEEADGRHHRHLRRLGRLHDRDRHRPHRGAAHLDHRLDRRALPVSGSQRPAQEPRRQGRGHQERPAQGVSRTRSSRPPTRRARVIQGVVDDTFNWFVDIVAERRGLARADALSLADGRIYTGQQALAANLIDEIGGEQAAIAWLASKGVDTKLPVRDWKPSNRRRRPVLACRCRGAVDRAKDRHCAGTAARRRAGPNSSAKSEA